MSKKYLVWFDEVDKHDVGLVGGKGANLGEMTRAGFPIPFGFVVTAGAYFYFLKANKLAPKIQSLLFSINYEDPKQLSDASSHIRHLISTSPIPHDLTKTIVEYYDNLVLKEGRHQKKKGGVDPIMRRLNTVYGPPLVAVRSSATAEDLPDASFAGQQETYLNVQGENHLIQKVREAWASLFTERAMYYRNTQKYDHMKVGLAAVVQRMVQSSSSGIAFSIDPITNDKSRLTIESIFGLGEYIVGGKVTPDHYEVDKKTFTIVKKEIKQQQVKMVRRGVKNVEARLGKTEGQRQKITDNQILDLSKIVVSIEKHYFFPQDIEWAVEGNQIYIVQSRPITTINNKQDNNLKSQISNLKLLLKGAPASPGLHSGPPVIIHSPAEIDKVKKGDILVAPQTNPDYVPAMKRATGIITERGGRTSHAAIVSRELGIPAVVGAENATQILKHEKIITVNGSTGEIYRGNALSNVRDQMLDVRTGGKKIKTLTKIYVNLAQPDEANRIAKMDVDGVGLLRAEFMIAGIGTHPKVFIKEGRQREFIAALTKKLLIFAKAFAPRPVVYRATDFKTNEYKNLKGGAAFEPHEENPMIGYRGASRYIADPEVFAMELAAIKKVRAAGYKNINLMIPFLRVPGELVQIKEILREHELLDLPSFKLWVMVEVPSAVLLLEDIIKVGIDGISIGTNDLTMLLLGVDRDNEEIAHLYDERNPAVLWALEKIVKTARKHGITASVCGQAPSDYPDLAEKLVSWGATSLSLNPDAVDRTRELIHDLEKKIWHK